MSSALRHPPVVVGVDGSPTSGAALRWAIHEASTRRVPIHLVSAWNPSFDLDTLGLATRTVEDHCRAILDAARNEVTAADPEVEVTSTAYVGPATTSLVEASLHADTVVVGSRGRRALPGFLLGATSLEVAAHAACPGRRRPRQRAAGGNVGEGRRRCRREPTVERRGRLRLRLRVGPRPGPDRAARLPGGVRRRRHLHPVRRTVQRPSGAGRTGSHVRDRGGVAGEVPRRPRRDSDAARPPRRRPCRRLEDLGPPGHRWPPARPHRQRSPGRGRPRCPSRRALPRRRRPGQVDRWRPGIGNRPDLLAPRRPSRGCEREEDDHGGHARGVRGQAQH